MTYAQFPALFKAFPLPSLLLLPDAPRFTIAAINPAYLEATGTIATELIGKSILDIFGADYQQLNAALLKSLLTVTATLEVNKISGCNYRRISSATTKEVAWQQDLEHLPVLDETSNISFIIHTLCNTAARDLSLLINNTAESFVLLDTSLRIVLFNKQFHSLYKKYFGLDVVKGDSILTYSQPERKDIISAIYKRVLEGATEQSAIAIPVSENESRHFTLKYEPTKNELNHITGVFVTARDVTEAKEQENIQAALINNTNNLIWSMGVDFKLIAANTAFINSVAIFSGISLQPGDDLRVENILSPGSLSFWEGAYRQALSGESFKKEIHTPAFAMCPASWAEISFNPIRNNNIITGIACYSTDITERKKAEQKVRKDNRLYTFISQVNQNIVHIKDEAALFRNACQIAFEFGKFKMAWIGTFDHDAEKISLIEQRGIPEEAMKLFSHASYQNTGPQDHILRNGSYFVCNDIGHDLTLENWKPFAAKYGLGSVIVLPIRKTGKIIGSFNLYADDTNFFDIEEIKLLTDVTADISFALEIFDQAKKQQDTKALLVKNENLFRAIIEKSTDIKTLSTAAGEMIYGSPSITTVLGYTPDEFLHRSAFDLIHPDDIPAFKTKREAIMQTAGSSFRNQNRFLHKNGNWIWCEGIVTNMLHEPGVNALVSNFRDISEKKIAEQQRELDSINLNALINNTTDLMWSVDKAFKLIDFNQPFFDIIQAFSGKTLMKGDNVFSVVLSPGQLERFKISYARALTGENFTEIVHIEAPVESWAEISYYPIRNGKEVIGTACHSRDITDRKKREAAALFSLNEKNTILESIDDAFFAVDKNWMVTYWNSHAEKVLGKSKADIIDRNLWDVFSESIGSASYQKYHIALETSQSVHFEDYYPPLEKWYEISAYPSGSGLSVYFKDVTGRKRSEMRLNELNQSLRKQTRELAVSNAELEQFAYVASHDLQEPLRMVTSFLTQLEKRYGTVIDATGKKYIDFAVDGAKRMRLVILDLLEFSRVGKTGDVAENIDLNELIKEVEFLLKKQIEEKKAVIRIEILPTVHAHKVPLRQVFQNLIGNALKYARKDIPVRIHITVTEIKDHWQFGITDNGIGIDKEYFDKIFIIFQRLHNKDEYSGTGMGLAVTKKVIEHLGGHIWVESAEGKGSTFYFTLLKQL